MDQRSAIVESFDAWAPSYDESALQPAYEAAHEAVLHQARQVISRPARVLDVGCGTGRLLRTAMATFPGSVLVGLDASWVMLSVSAERYDHNGPPAPGRTAATATAGATATSSATATATAGATATAAQGAAEALPFVDTAFDLVLCTLSFRHWCNQAAGIREIGRVLAPGGVLGLAEVFTGRRRGWGRPFFGRRVGLVPSPLQAALAAAGLGVLSGQRVDGFGPITAITVVIARRHRDRTAARHRGPRR